MGQTNLLGNGISKPVEFTTQLASLKCQDKRTEQVALGQQKDGKYLSEADLKYTKEYCLRQVESEMWLWDMRCWDKYKDTDEMMAWLDLIEKKGDALHNCGHTFFCIKRLLRKGKTTKEEIIEAMLKNSNKQYARRLVKCFGNPELCPKYKKQGNYGNGICADCNK